MVINRPVPDAGIGSNQVVALIHEENGVYGISFPDFPGVISGGSTPDEAIARGQAALAFHVEAMIRDGEPLPNLRALAELNRDPEYKEAAQDAVVALLPFAVPGKTVRVNISIDEALLGRIDRAAAAHNQSRSAFLADAVRAKLKTG